MQGDWVGVATALSPATVGHFKFLFHLLFVGLGLIPESREKLRTIILGLQRAGAEAVVLACTELPLLIRSEDTPVKLFDTMTVHVRKAVTYALEE